MKSSILVLFILFRFSILSQASVYFVSSSGNDMALGDESHPWKTIQKAANTLIAGDTVFIKGGVYKERVLVQNSGTNEQYIVFINYQGEEVIIDGEGIYWWDWNGLFDINGKSYIIINGLLIKNSSYGGIWAENTHHIIIKNNSTYNTVSCGIGIWESDHVTVLENEVELACNDGEQECISIANSFDCEIVKNHVHHNGPGTNGGEGIDIKAGSHDIKVYQNLVHHLNNRIGIYADAWDAHTYDIEIFQNEVHHCDNSGIAVATERGGLIENVSFYNNISYYNKWGGLELGGWTNEEYSGPTPVKHIKFINNTSYKNGAYEDGWGHGIVVNNAFAEDIIIRNNICSQNNSQIGIEDYLSNIIVDHNLIDGINNAPESVFGQDSIIGEALFVDALSFNFHLLNNSPAIDNGSLVDAPIKDFDNYYRPYGEGVDIGAFEYNPASAVSSSYSLLENIQVFPNPFSEGITVTIHDGKIQEYDIRMYNNLGALVKTYKVHTLFSQSFTIETKNLVLGLYIVDIESNNKESTRVKLFKE